MRLHSINMAGRIMELNAFRKLQWLKDVHISVANDSTSAYYNSFFDMRRLFKLSLGFITAFGITCFIFFYAYIFLNDKIDQKKTQVESLQLLKDTIETKINTVENLKKNLGPEIDSSRQ